MPSLFFVALAIAAGVVWWSSGALPETVASHFAAGGMADGFVARGEYAAFMLTLVISVPAFVFFAGRLAALLPVQFVNLPNKQYWLAPQRREATLASLGEFGVWVAYATLGLLCVAHGFVVYANRQHPPRLEQAPFIGLLAVFFLALFAGMLVVLRRFFRVP